MSTMKKSGMSVMLAALCQCASGSLTEQTFTTVFSFDGSNGGTPLGLVQATDGTLYGTTQASGGTIFEITPSGTLTSLFAFNGLNNNSAPRAEPIQDTMGTSTGQPTTAVPGPSATAASVGRSSKSPLGAH